MWNEVNFILLISEEICLIHPTTDFYLWVCFFSVSNISWTPSLLCQYLLVKFNKQKGPDRNCASPIKWCKWTVWIFWIYLRHPMGSLEVLWCQFFVNQSHNILASQLLICWIFSIILHTKANPMTEPIRINLYLC